MSSARFLRRFFAEQNIDSRVRRNGVLITMVVHATQKVSEYQILSGLDFMGEYPPVGETIVPRKDISTIRLTLNAPRAPRFCSELLAELEFPSRIESCNLEFEMVGDRDVYNITAPFEFNGKTLLAGRVEKRETEFSEIVFFEQCGRNRWASVFTHPDFQGLQDPCVTWAGNELILGGVRYPIEVEPGVSGYRMDFYRGASLGTLRHFLSGPFGMKDIRFLQLPDGKVMVFSRPQGAIGGRGEIGFTIAPCWEAITAEMIADAPLFDRQVPEQEWGGANEVHLLKNGHLGILGHIACFDEQQCRHYYPMVFSVDPLCRNVSPIQMIAQRSFFPPGASKRPDLADVVFSGGMIRHHDGTASLFAGTSDAAAAVVRLPDPFLRFES